MYCIAIAPMMIILTLSGMHVLTTAGQSASAAPRRPLTAILALIVIILCIIKLPEVNHEIIDDGYPTPAMWLNYKNFPHDLKQPAIVLFRYHKGDNVNEEPVYNIDAINPDDAPIIRAHDLGKERDRELFTYYAQRQPNRTVYLFDRSTRQLVELGNVKQLAEGLTH